MFVLVLAALSLGVDSVKVNSQTDIPPECPDSSRGANAAEQWASAGMNVTSLQAANGLTYEVVHIEKTGSGLHKVYMLAACEHSPLRDKGLCPKVSSVWPYPQHVGPVHPYQQAPHTDRFILTIRDPYNHVRSNYRMGRLVGPRCFQGPFDEFIRLVAAGCYTRPFIQPVNAFDFYMRQFVDDPLVFGGDKSLGTPMNMVTKSVYHIGVTELMQESVCIFHGKIAMESPSPYNTMPAGCDCTQEDEWAHFSGLTHLHNHDHSEDHLNDVNRKTIDKFTSLDRELFKAALDRLEKEARKIEASFHVKIFCGDRLSKLRAGRPDLLEDGNGHSTKIA